MALAETNKGNSFSKKQVMKKIVGQDIAGAKGSSLRMSNYKGDSHIVIEENGGLNVNASNAGINLRAGGGNSIHLSTGDDDNGWSNILVDNKPLPNWVKDNGDMNVSIGENKKSGLGSLDGSGQVTISNNYLQEGGFVLAQSNTCNGVLKVSISTHSFTVTSSIGSSDSGHTFNYIIFNVR